MAIPNQIKNNLYRILSVGFIVITACASLPPIVALQTSTSLITQTPWIKNLVTHTPDFTSTPKPSQAVMPTFTTTFIPNATPNFTFSISPSNQVNPEDILREISFFGTGGGGDCPFYNSPRIMAEPPSKAKLMEPARLALCGWTPGETIEASMQLPNGTIENKTYSADSSGGIIIIYFSGIYDPIGKYTLTIKGLNDSFKSTIEYQSPAGAHIYITNLRGFLIDPNVYPKNKKILLYKFSPNEKVRVFAYKNSEGITRGEFKFVAWQEFQIGPDGNLLIESDLDADFFAAIGKVTGEVHWLFYKVEGELYDGFSKISP
jgi:hypothetical protein